MEMTFEEVFPTLPATGWLTEEEARLLWDSAKETTGPILEVGCYHGRSTCLLAALGRPLYAVDPFKGFDSDDPDGTNTYRRFLENVLAAGHVYTEVGNALLAHVDYRVYVFKERAENWTPRPVGFAYLDGDHTRNGTLLQIKKALACGAKSIGIHDVNDSGGGVVVRDAALTLLGPWGERVERLAVWRLEAKEG